MRDANKILECLRHAWSIDSSSRWTPANPAAGQCSVTALVLQDKYGGELLYTETHVGPHFYNRIDGVRYDFTAEQFDDVLSYDDTPCSRDFAFTDCSYEQYFSLKKAFDENWSE